MHKTFNYFYFRSVVMKYRIIAAVCVICLLVVGFGIEPECVRAAGNIYYVATTGSDSTGNGSLSEPWATPQHAANEMVAGDTCYIEAGTYGYFYAATSGSAGNYETFENYNGEAVKINGGSAWSDFDANDQDTHPLNYIKFIGLNGIGATDYGIDYTGCSDIVIQDCSFSGCKYSAIGNDTANDSPVSTNITIDGCALTNTNSSNAGEMISIMSTNGFVIANCTVYDTAATTNKLGIDCKVGCTNGAIHNNTIYGAGWAIYIDAEGYAESNISIYDNLIYNNTGGAICVTSETGTSSLSNIDIYNNLIYGNFTGIDIHRYGNETFNSIMIENNTLYDNDQYIYAGITFDMSNMYVSNSVIANNIIYCTVAGYDGIYYASLTNGGIIITNNLLYNSGGVWGSANVLGKSAVTSNPELVSPTTNFALQSNSPAINAASPSYSPSTDYIGTARPQAGAYDIGAYEYIVSTTSASPLRMTTSSLPNGTVGEAYSQTLAATGGTAPYSWTITSGILPAGLSLSSSGVISGIPTTAGGPNSVTFQVTDSTDAIATEPLSIVINPALSITTSSLPNGTVGEAYSQTLAATGGTAPYIWALTSGTLPAGLSLSSVGVISGTPTTSASATSITVSVTDSANAIATKTMTVPAIYAAWDVNMDGSVNVLDLILIAEDFGQTGTPGWIREDVNSDGVVNIEDLIIVGQHCTG
jgi:hypothetical protein